MWKDEAYLLDMWLAADKIRRLSRGVTEEAFLAQEMMHYAFAYLIPVIGEAARQISVGYRTDHPEIPWQDIVGMRHRLVHDYASTQPKIVWGVVQTDIPALLDRLAPLVPPKP
jgi:uncharacterized protein with HEPN domain